MTVLIACTGTVADGVAHRRQPRLGVVDEIDLGHHDERMRAGVVHDDELALEPARAQRRIDRVHEEHAVDVGRDDLRALRHRRVAPTVGRAAHERTPARQQRDELFGAHDGPVADGGARQRIAVAADAAPSAPARSRRR